MSRRTDAGRRAGWGLHPARHLRPGPARTWSSVTSARCFREVRARWPEGVRYLARRPTQSCSVEAIISPCVTRVWKDRPPNPTVALWVAAARPHLLRLWAHKGDSCRSSHQPQSPHPVPVLLLCGVGESDPIPSSRTGPDGLKPNSTSARPRPGVVVLKGGRLEGKCGV